MAVRHIILYADSYLDLVALDISNPTAIREVRVYTYLSQTGVSKPEEEKLAEELV